MNTKLDTLIALVKAGAGCAAVDVGATLKDEGDSRFIVSHALVCTGIVRVGISQHILMVHTYSINLLRIPSKDASAYGRALLNTLFTNQSRAKVPHAL